MLKDLGDRSHVSLVDDKTVQKIENLKSIHNCAMLEIILSKLVVFASGHLNMKSLKLQAPWYSICCSWKATRVAHQGFQ